MRKFVSSAVSAPVLAALVALSALVVPGAARADEPAPPSAASAEASGGWDGRFVVGMSALGVSAVSLGLGILSTYQVARANELIRTSTFSAQFTQEQNVCVAAEGSAEPGAAVVRETCARGNTFNTLQYVMYGLHVGAGFAGVYLVVTSMMVGEKKGAARVMPVVSAGYGGVVVSGAF